MEKQNKISTVQHLLDINAILTTLKNQAIPFNNCYTILNLSEYLNVKVACYNDAFLQDKRVQEFKSFKEAESNIAFMYSQRDGTNKPIVDSSGGYVIDNSKLEDYRNALNNFYSSLNKSTSEIVEEYKSIQQEAFNTILDDEIIEKVDLLGILGIIKNNNLSISPNQLKWFEQFIDIN
jgi:hypothetical protein